MSSQARMPWYSSGLQAFRAVVADPVADRGLHL